LFNIDQAIAKLPETSSTISAASLLASTNEMYTKKSEEYHVPNSHLMTAVILKEMKTSDTLTHLLSEDNTTARIAITYHATTTPTAIAYINKVQQILNEQLKNKFISYEMGNEKFISFNALLNFLHIQLIAISSIYVSVFIIILIVFRSLKAGFVSIISNLIPLTGVMLVLYFFNIPFNLVSTLVLSATLGLAVDDTVHIMCSFKRKFLQSKNLDMAIEETIDTQLRPVTITTLTMVVGMSMLVFSATKASMQYGVLMASGSFMAWVADFILMPFLLKHINITRRL
jgi:predicted RND superfamily exporter protein